MCLGRLQEAIAEVKKISTVNGVYIKEKDIEDILSPLIEKKIDYADDSSEEQFFTILSHPRVLVRFVILCLMQ